jgi:aspartyl-tRNA(Asn)/glutamyl-tRNA(Gln) amidotransferase subunit A
MIAFASSLDQAGPMAKSAEDCALLLNAMAGFDARDSTSLERPAEDYAVTLSKPLPGLRIGLPRNSSAPGMDDDVRAAVEARWPNTASSAPPRSRSACPTPASRCRPTT